MGYRGRTFPINLAEGGFSYDKNIDKMPMTAMVGPTKNINLHKGGRGKRGGTDNVNATVIGGTPRIWGVYQFALENGNTFILTADANGEILKDYDDASPLKTGLTINRPVHFVTFNNMCVICTGNDLPQIWDGAGASTADIVNEATDWAAGNYPRKMIKHGRGVSERLWALYGKTLPHEVYASAQNAGDGTTEPNFVTGVLVFHIETNDGFGILNGAVYGDRLIVSGKNQMYIMDDTDADPANWGYQEAQWEGGTATDKTLITVTNDIISMTEDGTIYSVTTAQNYGDYKKASLTRTSPLGSPFMDEYIRDNIKLSAIADFHAVYDPVLRSIYFFVVRSGQTVVDTALCYFIDRLPDNGWVVKDNINFDSGFKASSSAAVLKATGDIKIYTGGFSDGFVWELETANKNDNGNPYSSGFKTPRGGLGNPRLTKRFDNTRILVEVEGGYSLFVDIWVDGTYIGQKSVSLVGSGDVYGTAVYGTARYAGIEIVEVMFSIGKVGKRIEYHIFNNNLNEDFFVSQILTDFKPLSNLAA